MPLRKRAFDLLMASLILALTWVLFLAIAVAIVLDSRGPVLYKACRAGKDDRPFTLYKFRTMRADAEQLLAELSRLNEGGPYMIRIPNDPRVTRVGRWLRRHNLDERPRPQAPDEVARYNDYQRRRLEVLPGITGLWQVSARHSTNFDDWVRLDLRYIDNWSFWLDLKICWRTARMLLFGSKIEGQAQQEADFQTDRPNVHDS
jgi:lipopolysaccharide/colanic/teichoic acid biosynthesis glycosyltransferase